MSLFHALLRLADNNLILGHRLSEWCGHAPVLEEDIALANIALDLIGQARNLYTYAGEVEGKGRDENKIVYFRDANEYKNALLCEQPNGDFAVTIFRQLIFSSYALPYYEALRQSKDETLKAIAEKAVKELKYHVRHSAQWVIRLGDGTEESRKRLQEAISELTPYIGELFEEHDEALVKNGILPDKSLIKPQFEKTMRQVLNEATLSYSPPTWSQTGGCIGNHSEHLGFILAELQFLQRTYPNQTW
jgi:ring-1,2-phenylacetyl-CoA epoxidase subunit PaaC